jgi:hypothetical protein
MDIYGINKGGIIVKQLGLNWLPSSDLMGKLRARLGQTMEDLSENKR